MISDEADKVINKLFDLLENRYQNNLKSMKGREFLFNFVHLMYYKCYEINLNCGGSYIDFLNWIKNKKATINAINKKDSNAFNTL